MTENTGLRQVGGRVLAVVLLTSVSFAAGAVSTHPYAEEDTAMPAAQLDVQAHERQTNDENVAPRAGPAAVPGFGEVAPDDTSQSQQPRGNYKDVPKVGDVRIPSQV